MQITGGRLIKLFVEVAQNSCFRVVPLLKPVGYFPKTSAVLTMIVFEKSQLVHVLEGENFRRLAEKWKSFILENTNCIILQIINCPRYLINTSYKLFSAK